MIEPRHMPFCPFCQNHMRARGPGVEIVNCEGLLGLAHSHCIARETRTAPKAAPPIPAEAVMQRQPERV